MIGYNKDTESCDENLFLLNKNKRYDGVGAGPEGKHYFTINQIIHGYLPEYTNEFKLK